MQKFSTCLWFDTQAEDAANPQNWLTDALYLPQSRAAYQRLLNLGLTDAIRAQNSAPGTYSYWDFQAGAWERNNGIRIDHMLLSPERFHTHGEGISSPCHRRGYRMSRLNIYDSCKYIPNATLEIHHPMEKASA